MSLYSLPVFDQTNEKANWDRSEVFLERQIELHDGRPALIQSWYDEGYTFETIFLSAKGLEEFPPRKLLQFLYKNGIDSENYRWKYKGTATRLFTDSTGEDFWSVTITVGAPD